MSVPSPWGKDLSAVVAGELQASSPRCVAQHPGGQVAPATSQPSAHSWVLHQDQPYLRLAYLHEVFLGAGD